MSTAATGAGSADQERAKRVLMLFSESKDLPANIFLERATPAELEKRSRARLEFYAEYLDATRFPSENYYRLFREYLREKYAQQPPDLLMIFYTRTLKLAGRLPAELFRGVPVVAAGLSEEEIPLERLLL